VSREKRKPKGPVKPSAARRGRGGAALGLATSAKPSVSPQYKVAELSAVDETSLENTINEWVRLGWQLDAIHFAMRESSRRPAMAFVLFTRPVEELSRARDTARPYVSAVENPSGPSADPWRRLRQLAGLESERDLDPGTSE
jgi:hypothetical protein